MSKKQIDRQLSLGLVKTFRLSLEGLQDRLFRSLITVGVIAVAVVFMMNVIC